MSILIFRAFPNVAFDLCPANSDLRVSVSSEQLFLLENPLWKPPELTVLIGRYAREAFLGQDLSISTMKEKSDTGNILGKVESFSLKTKPKTDLY